MSLGANQLNVTKRLAHCSTGQILRQLVKGSIERSDLVDAIDRLNVPIDVKYALIKQTDSEISRAHVAKMVETLGGDIRPVAGSALMGEVLNRIQWESLLPKREEPREKAEKVEPQAPASWVYFIESKSSGLVKIGYSNNPQKRLKEIKTMSPELLELVAIMPGAKEDEFSLHEKFAHLRKHGEWFEMCSEIGEFISGTKSVEVLS